MYINNNYINSAMICIKISQLSTLTFFEPDNVMVLKFLALLSVKSLDRSVVVRLCIFLRPS